MHCDAEGQSTPHRTFPLSSGLDVRPVLGEPGSKLNSVPPLSTAVHWVFDGQATDRSTCPESIETGDCAVGAPGGDPGSKATTCPASSPATHWLVDRQLSPRSAWP